MILVVLATLCVLSVPLTGGRLQQLAWLRVRGAWLPVVALLTQTVIVSVLPGGNHTVHAAVHIATYALLGVFLLANRQLRGSRIIALGTLLNGAAILANRGVMPAAATAERLAGLHLGGGFHNSSVLAHPLLLWLGDVIPVPGPLPNVLSVGDLAIFTGMLVLLHRSCSWRARTITLRPPLPA